MEYLVSTLTSALIVAVCIAYLDLVQGYMDRYFYGFFAIMMCSSYAVFLGPAGSALAAEKYFAQKVFIVIHACGVSPLGDAPPTKIVWVPTECWSGRKQMA